MWSRRFRVTLVTLLMLAPLAARNAGAQDRPAPSVDVEAGWVGFADDGIVSELLAGGAARWYLSPRLSIGPEIAYIGGDHHSHLVVTGNLTADLLREDRGHVLVPFLVIGGGLFQTRETFFDDAFTSREGAFTAGGGVRAILSDRVTAGAEVRIGWEPHLRINGTIGIRLGG